MKQLVALTEDRDFVCYRYRIEAFRSVLADYGWELAVLPRARSFANFLTQLPVMAAADAVVLQRRLNPWLKCWLIRRASKILIYDFDDAVFCRDSNHQRPAQCSTRWRQFRRTVVAADACLAGNSFLQAQGVTCADKDRVHRLPTCVDHRRYPLASHGRVGDVQLVWVGSRSTLPSLHLAAGGLLNASRKLSQLTLKVICDTFLDLPGVRIQSVRWSEESEAKEIAEADIGIAWLPEHPWSMGKCGLKVLQYMAAGLPVVANPIGIHNELIVDGVTGFFAATPEQWGEVIETLALNPDLRRQMGNAGRQRVMEHYNPERWGKRFAEIVSELPSRSRKAIRFGVNPA